MFGEVYCVYSVRIPFERFIPKSCWLTGATITFKGREGSRCGLKEVSRMDITLYRSKTNKEQTYCYRGVCTLKE